MTELPTKKGDTKDTPEQKKRTKPIEACYVNKDAVRAFLKGCPDVATVQKHLRRMEHLSKVKIADQHQVISKFEYFIIRWGVYTPLMLQMV